MSTYINQIFTAWNLFLSNPENIIQIEYKTNNLAGSKRTGQVSNVTTSKNDVTFLRSYPRERAVCIICIQQTQGPPTVNPYHAQFLKWNNLSYIFGTVYYHF